MTTTGREASSLLSLQNPSQKTRTLGAAVRIDTTTEEYWSFRLEMLVRRPDLGSRDELNAIPYEEARQPWLLRHLDLPPESSVAGRSPLPPCCPRKVGYRSQLRLLHT
jgi:hypothetical protein